MEHAEAVMMVERIVKIETLICRWESFEDCRSEDKRLRLGASKGLGPVGDTGKVGVFFIRLDGFKKPWNGFWESIPFGEVGGRF